MGVWDTLIHSGDALLGLNSGVTDPDQLRFARSQGLLRAGSALLAAQPTPVPQSPLAAVGTGLQAGQQGAANALDMYDQLLQRNAQKATLARRQAFYARYQSADTSDPKILNKMFEDAISNGLMDEAKVLGEVIKTNKPGEGHYSTGKDGKTYWTPGGGAPAVEVPGMLGKPSAEPAEPAPNSRVVVRNGRNIYQNFDRKTQMWVDTNDEAPRSEPRPPRATEAERRAAANGSLAMASWEKVNAIATDPKANAESQKKGFATVADEVGHVLNTDQFAKLFKLPFFSPADAVKAAVTAGATPGAQRYIRDHFGMIEGIIAGKVAGARLSGPIIQLYSAGLTPGLDVEGNKTLPQSQLQQILVLKGLVDPEHADLWKDALHRMGVKRDPEDILSAGSAGEDKLSKWEDQYK